MISADGSRVLLGSTIDSHVCRLLLADLPAGRMIPIGEVSFSANLHQVSADGSRLLLGRKDSVWVVDLGKGSPAKVWEAAPGTTLHGASASLDGRRILVHVYDPSGHRTVEVRVLEAP